jgi:S1-C subfamily serine protease
MSASLIEFSNALAQITEQTAASTVAVHSEPRGSSSGVIWRPGVIVTAEHALQHDEGIEVSLPNGRVATATLAGRDPSTDLAVLKCADAASGAAEIAANLESLKPGSLTLVVGRTRASGPVAALGVVSLVARERRSWTGASLTPYIRLDVGLQPTAIGGAVVNAQGQIVGVATPRFARFGAIVVPAPHVHRIADLLLQKGHIPRGYLGVGLQTVRIPEALRESLQRKEKTGAIVLEVEPQSPAQNAGLVIGDILLSLGGQPIARFEDVQSQLASEHIGKSLPAKILRGGAMQELSVAIAERPHGAQ